MSGAAAVPGFAVAAHLPQPAAVTADAHAEMVTDGTCIVTTLLDIQEWEAHVSCRLLLTDHIYQRTPNNMD